MPDGRNDTEIADAEALRAHYGAPSAISQGKQIDHIDRHIAEFIGLSPFLVMATSGPGGVGADASPRGDFPGFVKVLDPKTLAIPDRPGNNRLDSIANLVANPDVGLIFFIPGVNETIRVNGRARLTTDPDLLATMEAHGKPPRAAILIEVVEAYTHCAKALIRSKLWEDDYRIERSRLPTPGEWLRDHAKTGMTAAEYDAGVLESRKTRMW
ncbi:MAG: pyridoxamine 5'-phosphate oxidase family protein [Alphaproteobacteria bacterium]